MANISEAEKIILTILPTCTQVVLGRLQREKISSASDLAGLDKQDLKDLGFTMLERNRVLSWSETSSRSLRPLNSPINDLEQDLQERHASLARSETAVLLLEQLGADGDFWCGFRASWPSLELLEGFRRCSTLASLEAKVEMRVKILEGLFDLTPERTEEVYNKVVAFSERTGAAHITPEVLSTHLQSFGLPELNAATFEKLLRTIVQDPQCGLQLREFQTILSRLILAFLVTHLEADARPEHSSLLSIEYCEHGFQRTLVMRENIRAFLFRTRPYIQAATLRDPLPAKSWIHLEGLNLMQLLGLGAKYCLHPLAIEATIQQGPSKAQSFGHHMFIVVRGLCLASDSDEERPVEMKSDHISVFCAGQPTLDTVITVSQEELSFSNWRPVTSRLSCSSQAFGGSRSKRLDSWSDKVRARLENSSARLRERRSQFLVHSIFDVCADALKEVVDAYGSRATYIQREIERLSAASARFSLSRSLTSTVKSLLEEVTSARLELSVVGKRAEALEVVIRQLVKDPDFMCPQLGSYMQDVAEHLVKVIQDAGSHSVKCSSMIDAYTLKMSEERNRLQRCMEEHGKQIEARREFEADRMNNTLFLLTIVTTVFAPAQFMAGVYGMNFVDAAGTPTIPELLWPNGYAYFWSLTVSYLLVAGFIVAFVLRRARRRDLLKAATINADENDIESFLERD